MTDNRTITTIVAEVVEQRKHFVKVARSTGVGVEAAERIAYRTARDTEDDDWQLSEERQHYSIEHFTSETTYTIHNLYVEPLAAAGLIDQDDQP